MNRRSLLVGIGAILTPSCRILGNEDKPSALTNQEMALKVSHVHGSVTFRSCHAVIISPETYHRDNINNVLKFIDLPAEAFSPRREDTKVIEYMEDMEKAHLPDSFSYIQSRRGQSDSEKPWVATNSTGICYYVRTHEGWVKL